MANYNLFDAASLVMIPTGTKDGKLYSIKPEPVYGSEKIINSSFTSDTAWSKGDGWSIGGGLASCDGTQTANSNLFQDNSFEAGKTYDLSFTISNYQSGTITLFFGNTVASSKSSNGVFVQEVVYTSGAYLFLQATSAFVGSVDNVSVKEVVTADGDFTFTRGSNLAATRVDSAGLIEKGRENLLLQSNNFNSSPWIKSSTSLTSGQSGYDGSSDAWLFTSTASSGQIKQFPSSSGVNTYSVYAKAGTLNWLRMLVVGGSNYARYFDLQNGVIGSSEYSDEITQTITSVGNGWYRCSMTTNTTITEVRLFMSISDLGHISTTSGNIIIQDSQLELGLVATAVIETTTTIGKAGILEELPRLDYSNGASCPSLLLEPSRTNLITQSEYFGDSSWTKTGSSVVSGFTSPEGLSNSYKLVEDTSTGKHRINLAAQTLTANTYSGSFFAKKAERDAVQIFTNGGFDSAAYANFDLTNGVVSASASTTAKMESLSDGWYRCSYTFNGSVAVAPPVYISIITSPTSPKSEDYTGNGTSGIYLFGAGLEQASYATSYIPNNSGGIISRAADVATSTPSPIDSTGSLSILLGKQQESTFTVLGESFLAASLVNNIAIAYSPTALKVSLNGAIVVNATGTYDTSSLSSLQLGHLNGADQMSGGVKNLIMFNTFLLDTELNALTV